MTLAENAIHRRFVRQDTPGSTTTKQKQLSAQPATKSNPHIVENQCGSSVITQSTAAKVTIKA